MPTAEGLYFEEAGEGEPLLMVMGLGTDHLGWMLQVPDFSKHYRVITFDNRDVGQSKQADAPYGVADMAQDALALADHLELESFNLVGMSMGGAIAQEMALAAPERTRTLTLVVTFGGGGNWAGERARLWADAMQSREQLIDWLLLFSMSEQFFENPGAVEYSRELLRSNPHPQSLDAFRRQLAASGSHEARDRLGQLSMPVHVIGAEHDVLVPVWKSKEIAELIPNADYSVMESAPHALNMERAQEFNELVLEWLKANAPQSGQQAPRSAQPTAS